MGTIVDILANSIKLKVISDAFKMAGLCDVLNSDGPLTVFAPTDEALAQVPKSIYANLLEDMESLRKAANYYLVEGILDSRKIHDMLKDGQHAEVKTIGGHDLTFSISGVFKKHIKVNEATIISSDIPASNGIIHAIDKPLLIPGCNIYGTGSE